MKSVLGLIVFLSVVTGLYLAMNGYALGRVAMWLGIRRGWGFYLLLIALTASFPAAIALERAWPNFLTSAIYHLATTWLGVVWLGFWCVFLMDIAKLVLKLPAPMTGRLAILLTAGLSLASLLYAQVLRVRTVEVKAPVALNMVQLSDIHLGSTSEAFLRRVVEKTNALQPDVVFITGDLLDHCGSEVRQAVKALNELNAPVYFVTGNHEYYAGLEQVLELLKATPLQVLRNEMVEFKGVQVIGIDDSFDRSQVRKQLKNITLDPQKYHILLYHQPEGFAQAHQAGINLMLSGHTHNGQIVPFNLVVGMVHRFIGGTYQEQGALLNVSRGTGTWGPRMRLGTSSEIVLIKLMPK